MNKFTLALILLCSATYAQAQGFLDLKRYSFTHQQGTARSMGMGNALGAVGADYTVSSINPASLALIRSNSAMLTLGMNFTGTSANYLNQDVRDTRFNFSMPNMGFVFSTILMRRGKEVKEGLVNYTIAFGFNRINDFNRNMSAEGINTSSSYLDYLAEQATKYIDYNSVSSGFTPQYPEDLALAANTIVHTGNNVYEANLPATARIRQNYRIQQSGRQGDWNLSWAGNFSHRVYLGAGIGIPGVKFNFTETITETTQDTSINPQRSFETNNIYTTTGVGINAKLGITLRAADWFRVGFAYHTPTRYSLTDDFSYNFKATNFGQGPFVYSSGELLLAGPATSSYSFTTPGKIVASAAFIFKKLGLVSVDYEYIDYTTAQTNTADLATSINRAVRQNLQPASNLRVGAEFNYQDIRFRAGYGLYMQPFKSSILNELKEGNLNLRIYSVGAGYQAANSPIFFDAAVTYSRYDDFYTPYSLETTGRDYYTALSKTHATRIVFTIGSKF